MSEQSRSEPQDLHGLPCRASREPTASAASRGHVGSAAFLIAVVGLAALLTVPGCGKAGKGPRLAIAQKSIQLGEIAQEKKAKLTLALSNTGSETLVIDQIRVS